MLQLAWKQGDPFIQPASNPIAGLYADHHAMVFRTAYRITGNAADAEDALQTVFVRLMTRDAGAAEILQPESYLRRAAIHVSLDLIRARQAKRDLEADGVAPGDPELRHALRQALAGLEQKHAEMFTLRFLEGYENGEIAAMMGISKLSVAVTLHRIRRRLQQEFRKVDSQ
ncbi:MAG: sigma-70 family RNA polymerase sigma factor [Candidatus Solibacter usitatus]|nr:sigma-70 family RNA polymerase sigma factor [Candidatus Solibacter usitatus]